jgi:demethylmenaquinone methyltransferase / 2-methoxy-6-polyprenyl-1,4-benzoquinol methylase
MSKFFKPGSQRAQGVSDLFARVARRYDLINDLQSFGMHRCWKNRLVELSEVQPGEPAIDLCCGTGDVAFAMAERGAQVTGLDFSPAMLEVATNRSARGDGFGRVEFLEGDASQTGLPADSFDVVTMSYGLRNLPSWEKGLEEMRRLVRPGGRLLILEFGKPNSAVWRRLYFAYLRWVVPVFGKFFCGDSDTHSYIYASLVRYPAQDGVLKKMEELGMKHCQIVSLLGGVMTINLARK